MHSLKYFNVHILAFLLLVQFSLGQHHPNVVLANENALRCPNPEDISPCICTGSDYIKLDCSNVISNEQLQAIFEDTSKFPVKNLYKLTIENATGLTKLDTDFKDVTFERFILNELPNVVEVTARFFQSSVDVFEIVRMFMVEKLASFPFEQIHLYKNLYSITIRYSNISALPMLVSDSMEQIQITDSPLSRISPGTFEYVPKIGMVSINNCPIKELKAKTIPVGRESYTGIYITGTHIEEIEPTAIYPAVETPGRFGIDMNSNRLRSLNQTVWQPLFEKAEEITLDGNPISCGCDILWLIQRQDFIRKMTFGWDNPTCANTVPIQDLHVDIMERKCHDI